MALAVLAATCPLQKWLLCVTSVWRAPPSYDKIISAFRYQFPLDHLIHSFKDLDQHLWARWLGDVLIEQINNDRSSAQPLAQPPLPDLICAVPLHWRKQLKRGYNQSQLLAKALSKKTGVPEAPLLQKHRHTSAQRHLNKRQRQKNLSASLLCNTNIRERHVAVVDDVVTSGATAEAAALALKRSGATRVSIWALARTPKS